MAAEHEIKHGELQNWGPAWPPGWPPVKLGPRWGLILLTSASLVLGTWTSGKSKTDLTESLALFFLNMWVWGTVLASCTAPLRGLNVQGIQAAAGTTGTYWVVSGCLGLISGKMASFVQVTWAAFEWVLAHGFSDFPLFYSPYPNGSLQIFCVYGHRKAEWEVLEGSAWPTLCYKK